MREACIAIRDAEERFRIQTIQRDWQLLSGPGFREGEIFTSAFGLFAHFTVAGGIPRDSLVRREGRELLNAARVLLHGVQRDEELLGYDYSYSLSTDPGWRKGFEGVSAHGCRGSVSARPHGFCHVELSRTGSDGVSRVAELLDLRVLSTLETDQGTLRVRRKKAEMRWLEILPPLIEFLKSRTSAELIVEHNVPNA